jgi:hypothetical protein
MKDEYSMEEVKQEEFKKGEAQGLAKGLAQGEAQGERKMRFSLAQKLLQQGQLDLVGIADLTGLTIEELHSL